MCGIESPLGLSRLIPLLSLLSLVCWENVKKQPQPNNFWLEMIGALKS